jgi:hypothetical protein
MWVSWPSLLWYNLQNLCLPATHGKFPRKTQIQASLSLWFLLSQDLSFSSKQL